MDPYSLSIAIARGIPMVHVAFKFVLFPLFVCSDTSPSFVKNQNTPAIERGKKVEQADWKGQVTAREVAKKAKAQQLRISNTVVRVSGSSDSSTSL